MAAKIVALCLGKEKGANKIPVPKLEIRANHGIVGDIHAGRGERQISLLDWESLSRMRRAGFDVNAGDFSENITIWGVRLADLPVGTRLAIGPALLELTQIGRSCGKSCIAHLNRPLQTGGAFARVLEGGTLRSGATVRILKPSSSPPSIKTEYPLTRT